jgi:hypothetical protein
MPSREVGRSNRLKVDSKHVVERGRQVESIKERVDSKAAVERGRQVESIEEGLVDCLPRRTYCFLARSIAFVFRRATALLLPCAKHSIVFRRATALLLPCAKHSIVF